MLKICAQQCLARGKKSINQNDFGKHLPTIKRPSQPIMVLRNLFPSCYKNVELSEHLSTSTLWWSLNSGFKSDNVSCCFVRCSIPGQLRCCTHGPYWSAVFTRVWALTLHGGLFCLDFGNTEGHFLLDGLLDCAGSNAGSLAQEVCKNEWLDSVII